MNDNADYAMDLAEGEGSYDSQDESEIVMGPDGQYKKK